jgi:hypothetical protein
MPRPTIEFNDALFRAQSRSMLMQLGIAELPFIRGEAGFFAQTLAKITPPFTEYPQMRGAGYNTQLRHKKAGENAIKRDMANVFTVRSRGYLEFLIRRSGRTRNIDLSLTRKDGTDYDVRILEINTNSVGRALGFHDRQQNNRGRTPRYTGNGQDRWTSNLQLWITEEIWDQVYETLSNRVGLSKAALAEVAVSLGRPSPAQWVARHMGFAAVTTVPEPAEIIFSSTAPGLDVAARRIGSVEQFRLTAMRSKLNRMVRDQARSVGWTANIV